MEFVSCISEPETLKILNYFYVIKPHLSNVNSYILSYFWHFLSIQCDCCPYIKASLCVNKTT